MWRGQLLGVVAAFSLSGCFLTLDSSSPQAVSPTRPAALSCSACHPYDLRDKNHFTHLIYNAGEYVKKANYRNESPGWRI
jgi:hypothetical protein